MIPEASINKGRYGVIKERAIIAAIPKSEKKDIKPREHAIPLGIAFLIVFSEPI